MTQGDIDQEDLPPEHQGDDPDLHAATSRDARGPEQLPAREQRDDDHGDDDQARRDETNHEPGE